MEDKKKSFPDILKIITSNVHFSQFNKRTRSYSLIIRFSKERNRSTEIGRKTFQLFTMKRNENLIEECTSRE